MDIRIALAGNPNSGKTTMFNELTGSSQYVGNWPGVTVEKKEGRLKGNPAVFIQDLPGIYSLSPYTLEERITRTYLVNEAPDAIVDIIDGSNIERNLYLTTQLLELGLPMAIAVNMIDVVRKRGDEIDVAKLSAYLGCPVTATSALKGEGAVATVRTAVALVREGQLPKRPDVFSGCVATALGMIEKLIMNRVHPRLSRWYAVKLFERDADVSTQLALDEELRSAVERLIAGCEQELDDDAESIVANERYAFVGKVVQAAVKHKRRPGELSASDRIDSIMTHRLLALPLFALVMFLVYYLSITTVGSAVTDWTNDVLFGELVSKNMRTWLQTLGIAGWLVGLVVDGIIGGVGAVLGFVPQMLVLFVLLSILEDVGYMARIAFIMDRIFRKIGLSGKSFIHMLISSGCAVPGVMASRTIEQERDRRMTIMTTSFMPCGAKMPIVALFAGAFFGGSTLVATSAYFIGVAAVILSGTILKKTKALAGDPAPFVMELPAYHVPSLKGVARSAWERGWSFIMRAGTVILVSSVVLWFLQGFGFSDGSFGMVDDNNRSLLASIGSFVAPVFAPLGFGFWQAAVATFTGLIAKENVVGTFGVLYGFSEIAEDGRQIWSLLSLDFTRLSAYSFMVFNLLCAPCFATIGAIKREMNSSRWTWAAIGYMTAFAYTIALIVHQLGLAFNGGGITIGTATAIVLLAALLYLVGRKNRHGARTATV